MFIEQGPGIRVQELFTFPWNAASSGMKRSNHFTRTEKEWSKRYETPVEASGFWCELSVKDQCHKPSQSFPSALTLLMGCEGFVQPPSRVINPGPHTSNSRECYAGKVRPGAHIPEAKL